MSRTVSSRDLKFFNVALKLAEESECNYKHSAIIIKGGIILSMAVNKRTNHKITRRYGAFCISMHAEIRAILKIPNTRNTTVYSARLGKSTKEPRKSKPCSICMEILRELGTHTIVYYDGKEIIKETI